MEVSEMLQKLDTKLAEIFGSQAAVHERLKKVEGIMDPIPARLNAYDELLQDTKKWIADVEKRSNQIRFTESGGDNLLAALPDDLRPWVERVKSLRSDEPITLGGQTLRRSGVAARMAATDPVRYVAVGAWFQARIKAVYAIKQGKPQLAATYQERADKLAEALGGFSAEAKAALQEDTAGEGGYLIPTITETMVGALVKEAALVRQAGATVIQMTSKTHQLPTLANDFSVYWIAEEGTITDAAPATPFGQGTLTAKKCAGLVTVSIELIQDNVINLMDFILTHLIQQVGRAEDTQALEGDGTTFTGLIAASGVNSAGSTPGALAFSSLVKLIYGGEHQSTMDNGVVFCHPWVIRDAIQLITGTAGSPWLPFSIQNAGRPTSLLGQPVYPTSSILRNRGTGADTNAYHGNPAYIVIGDRAGTQFEVDPYGKFDTAQVRLRLMRRTGILIWVPAYFTKLTGITVAV
jgi:HK97 family phage major capsid protein